MRDPKYITTDRNRIRPRVNDTGNGLLRQRKWKYNKCFSSIIINSLLVNDGLNSTVHTFIFVVIIYYHILYIIIIFRNLLIITKPYEGIIYYLSPKHIYVAKINHTFVLKSCSVLRTVCDWGRWSLRKVSARNEAVLHTWGPRLFRK